MTRVPAARFLIGVVLPSLALSACGGARDSAAAPVATIAVFAAASLSGSFTEIGERFEADNPGVTVTFNFGSSSALAQQIVAGAPADVFAAASPAMWSACGWVIRMWVISIPSRSARSSSGPRSSLPSISTPLPPASSATR